MDIFERGMFIRTLESVEESNRGKKILQLINLLTTFLLPIIVFIIFSGLNLSIWFKIYFPIILFFMGITSDLLVQYMFSKSMGQINLYSNGLEPTQAWVHKLTGKRPFMKKERIASMQSSASIQLLQGGPYLTLTAKDQKGLLLMLGVRRKEDVEATLDYVKREWKIPVDTSFDMTSLNRRVEPRAPSSSSPSMARKIPVGNVSAPTAPPPLLFCPDCGARTVPGSEFCPMCGHREGQPVTRYMPPQQTTTSQPKPVPQPVVEEISPLPSYLQKSPGLAFILAFLPGLFCIMGLGHFYVKRIGKGVILLLIGFFPGLLAWTSLYMAFTETRYEPVVYLITSMLLWALFASLLLWSAFDASKQARKFNALPPEYLLRSKDGGNERSFGKSKI